MISDLGLGFFGFYVEVWNGVVDLIIMWERGLKYLNFMARVQFKCLYSLYLLQSLLLVDVVIRLIL